MYIKKTNCISLSKFIELHQVEAFFPPEDIIGIQLKEEELTYDLYPVFSQTTIQYVLIIDLDTHNLVNINVNSNLSLAERLIQLLMHPSQYMLAGMRPVLFNIPSSVADTVARQWDNAFLLNLDRFGIRKVATYYATAANGPVLLFKRLQTNGSLQQNIDWEVHFVKDAVIVDEFKGSNKETATIQEVLLLLKEENEQLRSNKITLLKNIYDLNNYYRQFRGEVDFKHHNRDGGADVKKVSPSELQNLRNYYEKVYDQLPNWYKMLGVLLKVIFLKRELMYYFNKKHKKVFFDMLQALPKEKQIVTWYYYEYEILPGWYKKIGRLLERS